MDARHEEIKALIAPYVLGAVPAEEEATIRSHISSCDECRAEAESLGAITSSLSLAVEPVDLPDGFVERTLTRVAREREETAPKTAPVRRSSWAWVFSAAALALLVAVGAWLAFGSGTETPNLDEVANLLDRPGIELNAKGEDAVVAKVVETNGGAKFVARGMSPAPEGKIYQLWKMSETCIPGNTGPCDIQPAGTVEVHDGLAVADLEGGLGDFKTVAVTVEDRIVDEPAGPTVLASYSL